MAEDRKVRVRFAPSPTGGLHLGGVRTALFNYLFARQHGGDFILRIEDTDQTRFVPGAEAYINECLSWCGIRPDESPEQGGAYGPYRQSERKATYRQYAAQLVQQGHAYYAFDTAEALQALRGDQPNFRYGHENRLQLRNSLTLPADEVQALLDAGTPHVVRIKVPAGETVAFHDLIRGDVQFDTDLLDDKVLLKADGMPTYHLAVIVDDHAMEISHVLRGEEWLPSAPIHILLWEYLGWRDRMPQWAHLPLILKPDGNGKLSKRDGERLGFPVYAMHWEDPITGGVVKGFRELGFLPEAFVNMLAMLGWNDGSEKELYTLPELVNAFSVERISKAGAKFDFEKAKWFNHEWLKGLPMDVLLPHIKVLLAEQGLYEVERLYLEKVTALVRDRLTLLSDFWEQAAFFFKPPAAYDVASVQAKWNADKTAFFTDLMTQWEGFDPWTSENLEHFFKLAVQSSGLKAGELMLPFRIMLVGGKFGPHVFDIAATLGKEETLARMKQGLSAILI